MKRPAARPRAPPRPGGKKVARDTAGTKGGSKNASPGITQVRPHSGKRDSAGRLIFPDAPGFEPNLTPAQCIKAGIFGGCYFNPRGGKPGILGREVKIDHKEFPNSWFKNVPEKFFLSRRYCASTNKYGVKSGQDQAAWEMAGWIREQDPRGWFQWYCRFYQGRRSPDDARQIQRWKACAGFLGRWRNQLCSRINGSGRAFNDAAVAPVIRQTLLHWAYELTEFDWELWFTRGLCAPLRPAALRTMMSLRLVLQQLCCAHRTDASGHARFLDNRLQGATPALANVRRLSKGFGKVSTPVRIFYQSTGLDADRFDEAFRNSDLKAMVQLMDSKQAIENLLEPKHPWAEDPRTVGVLAALLMGLLASSVGEDDGAIREEVSNAGAIPALVRMLDSEDSDAEQTAVIVRLHVRTGQSCGAAFECGAVPKLIQLLQHTLPGLRGAAASCLRNMCAAPFFALKVYHQFPVSTGHMPWGSIL
eukprot:s1261_g1.t3